MKTKQSQKNILTGWQQLKLGEVCSVYDGTHQTPTYIPTGIPFYSVEHVTSNNFNDTKFVSEDVYKKEIKRIQIEKGDILMTRIGDIGTTKYIDWEVKASFYVSLALIKCFKGVNSKFINYAINSRRFKNELRARTLTVAFPNKINLGDISKCDLYLPIETEQNRIVSVLEIWENSIEKLSKKIEIKKQIKKGLMQDLLIGKKRLKGFGDKWKKMTLDDVMSSFSTGLNPRDNFRLGMGNNYYVTIKNISNGHLDFSNAETVDDFALKLINKRSKLSKNSIIMSSIGNVGESYLLDEDPKGWDINESVFCLKPNVKLVEPRFVYYVMTSYETRRYFENNITGSSFKSIKMKELKSMPLLVPDIFEQKEIIKILFTADKEIQYLEKKLQIIKDQKNYLLNNLITGTIRTPETLSIKP